MMNSAFVVAQAGEMAERIRREVGDDPADQFRRAWLLAFSRPATPAETESGLAFLAEQQAALVSDQTNTDPTNTDHSASGTPESDQPAEAAAEPPVALSALTHLCHALLISNEFLYVD